MAAHNAKDEVHEMGTPKHATLFTVSGPRGTHYALRDHESGTVLTERTESAAAAMADERGLSIVDHQEISHAELIEMMASRGDPTRKPPAKKPAAAAAAPLIDTSLAAQAAANMVARRSGRAESSRSRRPPKHTKTPRSSSSSRV